MRLAVLGDIHVYSLKVAPWQLLSKRIWGQSDLWLSRRYRFDAPRLFPRVIERLETLKPDLVLIPGDLTTTALPSEFAQVAKLIAPITSRFDTVIIPGNHDVYTFGSAWGRRMEKSLGAFMLRESPGYRRLTERWDLLSLLAAGPRAFSARGRVGAAALGALRERLTALPADRGAVVMCHYPFILPPDIPTPPWHHRLADAAQLRQVFAACKAQIIYVHGHIHRSWCMRVTEPGLQHVIDLNAGAPAMLGDAHPLGQGFWQVDLPDAASEKIGFVHHMPRPGAGDAVEWVARGHL